jgi:hypothetical protein
LEITGESEEVEGRVWWPVRAEVESDVVSGYVWVGGIAPLEDRRGLLDRLLN